MRQQAGGSQEHFLISPFKESLVFRGLLENGDPPLFEKVEMPLRAFTFHFYRWELGPTDSVQCRGGWGRGKDDRGLPPRRL